MGGPGHEGDDDKSYRAALEQGDRLLCDECREGWRFYIESLPRGAAEVFPELRGM